MDDVQGGKQWTIPIKVSRRDDADKAKNEGGPEKENPVSKMPLYHTQDAPMYQKA